MSFSSGSGKDQFYAIYDDLKVYVSVGTFANANQANSAVNSLGLYDSSTIARINPSDKYSLERLYEIENNYTELTAIEILQITNSNEYRRKKELIKDLIFKFKDKDIVIDYNTLEKTKYDVYALSNNDKIFVNLGNMSSMNINRNSIMKYDLFNLEYKKDNVKYNIDDIKIIDGIKDLKEFHQLTKDYKEITMENLTEGKIMNENYDNSKDNLLTILNDILNNGELTKVQKNNLKNDIDKIFEKNNIKDNSLEIK